MRRELFALFAAAALLLGMSACTTVDNPSSGGGNAQEEPVVAPAQLKQGIWTEYDEALLTSGKYTEEQLAQMPTVGMWIEGDKGYFFTYTGEETSEPVEGQVSYDNTKGKGSITFPTIEDNPLSDQTVSFSMTTDETMEFDYTYEGQKITATFAWLCENLDNWSSDITDEDWLALMADYQLIPETAGPDASIDWSKSVEVEDIDDNGNPVKVEVKDLDKPLVWEEDAVAPARTRAIGVGTVVSVGFKLLGALFKDDSSEKKLDAITEKVDKVLQGQQEMLKKLNEYNNRLTAIATQMQKQAAIDIINERNKTYYNPLKVRNISYFDNAYNLYTKNKDDLSKVSANLGDYAKKWAGDDQKYIDLTWNYINYLSTVQHSTYGTGMDKIYDGIIYDEYPWEHLGTEDRKCYRGNDLLMITKCLFMICLYSTYCNLDDIDKNALYNNYNAYRPQLEKFCEFNVTNPDEFRVCQIPGAHFVMHKELQKYNYCGKDNKAPDNRDRNSVYRPEWHEAGSIKIDNPQELKEKLIRVSEATAIYKYYQSLYNKERIWWYEMLVKGGEKAAGAVYSKKPSGVSNNRLGLLSYLHDQPQDNGIVEFGGSQMRWVWLDRGSTYLLLMGTRGGQFNWGTYYSFMEYYAAIVENRY
jgi:hypothetical protein